MNSGSASRSGRTARGERLGGFIYGTILVLAVVVSGAKAYPDLAGRIAVLVLVTAAVFWLAHVYAHGLAHSVAADRHLSLADLKRIARREASIMESALPLAGALLLGAFDLISTTAAVWLAIGLGLAVLAAQGVTFARVERLGYAASAFVITANLLLGVFLIALKILVTH